MSGVSLSSHFKWFKCRASGCSGGMPGCPNDYKYLDGKVRINATFVLLVISLARPGERALFVRFTFRCLRKNIKV